MIKPQVSMREALADDALLGKALAGESWRIQRMLLIAAMGEALTPEERELWKLVTLRDREPGVPVDEFWGCIGRRSGKTRGAGTLAAYIGGLCSHDYLASGERSVLPILSGSERQSQRAYQHTLGIIQESAELAPLIEGSTSEIISLSTRVDIEIRPANFRTIRGITSPAVIADEVAFWHIEGSKNPDDEILEAVRPGLATTGGPLWVISSPHGKRGALYETVKKEFRPDGDPLVVVAKGPSKLFNPSLPDDFIARAYGRDPLKASAEYGGEFRNDIAGFVTREIVDACVAVGVVARPPVGGTTYEAFVDPSGGVKDPMTLAIGHRENNRVIIDLQLDRKPPFSPKAVVAEFVDTLRLYRCAKVTGDRYGGNWPREAFREHGIAYEESEQVRSDLYRTLLPMLNSQTVVLLDHAETVEQLCALERRVARSGREAVDHPPGGHDDAANAVAGVASLLGLAPAFDLETYIKAMS